MVAGGLRTYNEWSLALFKYFCNEELRSGVPDSVTNGSVCARLHTHTQTDFKRMPDACSVSIQLRASAQLNSVADWFPWQINWWQLSAPAQLNWLISAADA